MLASGSLASASTAASRIRPTLLQKEELWLWSHGNKLKRRLELEGLAERDATCAVPLLGARVRGALAAAGDRA